MKRTFISALILSSLLAASFSVTAQRTVRDPRAGLESSTAKTISERTTEFARVNAYTDGSAVFLKWEMAVERDNLGFYAYRIDADGKTLVSDEMIGGSLAIYGAQPVYGESFSLIDALGNRNAVYEIVAVAVDGSMQMSARFVPTMVADLSSIDGYETEVQRFAAQSLNKHTIAEQIEPPKYLLSEIESNLTAPNPEGHRWVVSQPGVRIGAKKEGLHRVSRTELETAGFNVDSDPTRWQLYLMGNEQAIRVGGAGDYIEFMGKGIDRPESDTQMYFLINGSALGKRIQTRSARPSGSTVKAPSYDQTFVLKERTQYNNNIRNGDLENFWGRAFATVGTTLTFNLSGVDFSDPQASITVRLHGISNTNHQVNLTLNGESLTPASGGGAFPFSTTQQIPVTHLREGANTLFMNSATTGDTNYFDSIEINFARKHLANQGNVKFYTQTNKAATLTGFSSANIRIIDTTFTNDAQEVVGFIPFQLDGTFAVQMPAGRARTFFAFEGTSVNSAVSIETYGTELIGSPTQAAELVILTHKAFMTEANNWANYRIGQNINTKVIEISEVFDEFNYGVTTADAIKAFLFYAKYNWQTPPTYVLLIGDATYDPRRYLGFPFYNFVPTKSINTLFSETASDEFMADFNNDGLAELVVGRIPARTSEQVTLALNKVSNWEANLTDPLNRGVLFAYDLPDGYDFQGMSNRLRAELPAGTPSTMIGRGDAGAQVSLINSINTGKYLVNYSGHGSSSAWAGSGFFSSANVTCTGGQTACVNNPNSENLFTMLTCLNGFFTSPTASSSLAETLLFSTSGGAVAAWASTGLTTPDVQEIMAKRFYNRIGAGTIPRLGDLIRDAKTTIPGGTDVRLSWTLIGDPMLKVR